LKAFKFVLVLIVCCAAAQLCFAQENQSKKDEVLSPSAQILLSQLLSPVQKERINAALRLSNYNHPMVVRNLISAAVNDRDAMVKRVALRSLGKIGDPEALPAILALISSDDMGVVIEAMGAAVKFSTSSVKAALLEKADDPNPLIRQKAVAYLGELHKNNNQIERVLINKLEDLSEGVRVAACKAIAKKNYEESVPKLAEVLVSDRSEVVREYAAWALGEFSSDISAAALEKALEDPSPVVRITAAKSLAGQNRSSGLNTAIEGIKSSDPRIRVISCEVMGMVGNEDVRIFLQQAAQDYDKRVQRAAEKALNNLKNNNVIVD